MNVTCQVTLLRPGRIRLRVPNMATQPEIYHRLIQFLLSLAEVTRVEIEPASESVVVIHAPDSRTREAILQALRGKQAQASAQQEAIRSSLPSSPTAQVPYADCAVDHAMRGRVRMRIPSLRKSRTLAGVLAHRLRQQPGVTDVRLNRLSASIIIAYDPAVTDALSLATLVKGYDPDDAAIEHWRASQARPMPGRQLHRKMCQFAIGLAVLALALSLVSTSASPFVLALLLASSWWVFGRACLFLLKQHRLSFELLAASAITLLGVTGRLWQAALLIIALGCIELLRSSPQGSVDEALANALDEMNDFAHVTWSDKEGVAPAKAATTTVARQVLPLESAQQPSVFAATPLSTLGGVTYASPAQAQTAPEVDAVPQQ